MPNNNPSGHNQYTKRKAQTQAPPGDSPMQSGLASSTTEAAPSEAATEAVPSAPTPSSPARRGFAAMDEATQRSIAAKGGQSQGKENNPGNFANDRDRAREAGRKGGEAHGGNR